MSARAFDRKFGADFLTQVPSLPGVYRCFDGDGTLVYVGKAVDLRRRLGQYRNATRRKTHRKMRRIVVAAARIEVEVTADEREALLLEDALIKAHGPRLNVAGAYSFMYPFVGLKRTRDGDLHVAYSSRLVPLEAEGFRPFGCYRNRQAARSGFDALVALLGRVGHWERSSEQLEYTAWRRFRRIPRAWDPEIASLLGGESHVFLETVLLALLEKADARRDAAEIQAHLRDLKRFFELECVRLKELLALVGEDYLEQNERDAAAIRAGDGGGAVGRSTPPVP